MSDRKYNLPGLDDWIFSVSDYGPMLWHRGGAGVSVTGVMQPEQIAEQVKNILRQTSWTPDEAVIEAAAQAVLNIDWHALLDPNPVFTAPLLNAVPATPATAVQRVDNTALVDQICALVKQLA